MTLLITLVLTLFNFFIFISKESPTNSITNITKWMISCITFVYFAIMEYGCSLIYTRYVNFPSTDNVKNILRIVDLSSLVIAISSFIVFTLIFWTCTHHLQI